MFPGCRERCNVNGTLSEYSRNIACRLNIHIYYIGYVMIKDLKYVKINSVNPLCLIFNKVNGNLKEINKNKYLASFY